jgi:hypothetical protein
VEEGYVAGEAVRSLIPSNVSWIEKDSGNSYSLTSAGGFAWSQSPRLPATQCEGCGIIVIDLGSEAQSDP